MVEIVMSAKDDDMEIENLEILEIEESSNAQADSASKPHVYLESEFYKNALEHELIRSNFLISKNSIESGEKELTQTLSKVSHSAKYNRDSLIFENNDSLSVAANAKFKWAIGHKYKIVYTEASYDERFLCPFVVIRSRKDLTLDQHLEKSIDGDNDDEYKKFQNKTQKLSSKDVKKELDQTYKYAREAPQNIDFKAIRSIIPKNEITRDLLYEAIYPLIYPSFKNRYNMERINLEMDSDFDQKKRARKRMDLILSFDLSKHRYDIGSMKKHFQESVVGMEMQKNEILRLAERSNKNSESQLSSGSVIMLIGKASGKSTLGETFVESSGKPYCDLSLRSIEEMSGSDEQYTNATTGKIFRSLSLMGFEGIIQIRDLDKLDQTVLDEILSMLKSKSYIDTFFDEALPLQNTTFLLYASSSQGIEDIVKIADLVLCFDDLLNEKEVYSLVNKKLMPPILERYSVEPTHIDIEACNILYRYGGFRIDCLINKLERIVEEISKKNEEMNKQCLK